MFCLVILFAHISYATDHWGWGAGFTTDSENLHLSQFTIPLSHIYYEYSINNNFVVSAGIFGYLGFIPVVEANIGILLFDNPFEIKAAIGKFSDFVLSGHDGLMISTSVIIDSWFEIKIFGAPSAYYTQPAISFKESFNNGKIIKNENHSGDIEKGYLGLLICWRY